ncbi:MAG TPA: glycoside hydrolase family 1 protein [Burkholderiaceae bacterium]|jgi:beta-glucosidase
MRKYVLLTLLLIVIAALGLASQLGANRSPMLVTPDASDTQPGPLRFPKGFYWGVAIAGQQAESQQASDWTAFEEDAFRQRRFGTGPTAGVSLPGHIHDLGKWSDKVRHEKAGFETRYAADLAMAQDMGLNAFRFSIEWARLFPRAGMSAPDPAGIAYYKALIHEMKSRGITPFVTLFHYVSPAWFFEADSTGRKGWEREDALVQWQRYVEAVADNFIPDVTQWCTLNEPMVYLYSGYIEGTYPPLERRAGVEEAAPVVKALLNAHLIAYQTLHRVAAERKTVANVGITENTLSFEPLRNWAPLDRLTAKTIDQAWNWDFLDAIETGRMTLTNTDIDMPIEGLKGTEDYVGINYYSRTYIKSDLFHPGTPQILLHDPEATNEPVNDVGWASYPHGFYLILTQARQRYGKPIFVLENGTADGANNDVARQKFLREHVREVWLARERGGVDVRSYIHWSLFDNFEWSEGFNARFGLVAVDYENDFKRTPRPSAKLFADIAHANALPAELR